MNIEQVKEEAKKRFNKDITDEQAKAWLDAQPSGELQDEELENVAGGCGGSDDEARHFIGIGSTRYSCGAFSPLPLADPQKGRTCNSCKYCFIDYSGSQPGIFCTRVSGPQR